MEYGDTLEIRLVDPKTTKVLYTEPLQLAYYGIDSTLDEALDSFRTGAYDAMKDVHRDIELNKRFVLFASVEMADELRRRGYKVEKC